MIITIDGPAASGKSSVSRLLAQKLGCYYLYSGLLYRSCAYLLSKYARYSEKQMRNPKPEDVSLYCNLHRLQYQYTVDEGARILFDGEDITPHLKSAKMDNYSSLISTHDVVRRAILAIQHAIAQGHNLIADGRDMGSIAFPDANYKFFLTASAQERARRWQMDQEKRGNSVTQEEALATIVERDKRDTIRPHSPLVIPDDAITVDNTNMNLEQTVEYMLSYIKN